MSLLSGPELLSGRLLHDSPVSEVAAPFPKKGVLYRSRGWLTSAVEGKENPLGFPHLLRVSAKKTHLALELSQRVEARSHTDKMAALHYQPPLLFWAHKN